MSYTDTDLREMIFGDKISRKEYAEIMISNFIEESNKKLKEVEFLDNS